jgi:hypothetical protein
MGNTRFMRNRAPRIGFDLSRSKIWEPACGEGHMAEPLREYCDDIIASDLHDYGYGEAGIDFLKAPRQPRR